MKIYHQRGAQLTNTNEGIDFVFGENNNYHQISNRDLEFDITLSKNENDFNSLDGDSNIDERIRLVKNAFADAFSIATLSATGGEEIELKNYCGNVSTIETFNK